MGRALPKYVLRDRITVQRRSGSDGRRRTFVEPGVTVRCYVEAGSVLRSGGGRRRDVGFMKVWVPAQRRKSRRHLETRRVRVTPRQVGSRVGVGGEPRVGDPLPVAFDRLETHRNYVEEGVPHYEPEDRVIFHGRKYQIVRVDESRDSPRGPDYDILHIRDQRSA